MSQTKNVYALPFNKKDLIKAISHPKAHFAHLSNAIDFILPLGTKVLASKAGKVIDIKVDSNKGGFEPKYNDMKFVNYLTIKHSNKEYSQYVHLKHNGSLVKIGDKVKQGQPIALSGNTGFTTAPHLHFHIFKFVKTGIGWETLKIKFKEKVFVDKTDNPVPKKFNKTLKELERVRKSLK
ncbi:M23 family metallopeptidase [Candidatus Woesearchaeota archaeon]|nr:M23 family metallopeptidase [Candidatus Woesearchaeota archaeon]